MLSQLNQLIARLTRSCSILGRRRRRTRHFSSTNAVEEILREMLIRNKSEYIEAGD